VAVVAAGIWVAVDRADDVIQGEDDLSGTTTTMMRTRTTLEGLGAEGGLVGVDDDAAAD
jgi:hypothetical protein